MEVVAIVLAILIMVPVLGIIRLTTDSTKIVQSRRARQPVEFFTILGQAEARSQIRQWINASEYGIRDESGSSTRVALGRIDMAVHFAPDGSNGTRISVRPVPRSVVQEHALGFIPIGPKRIVGAKEYLAAVGEFRRKFENV